MMFENLPPKRGYRWSPAAHKWVSIRGERVLTYVMSVLVFAGCLFVVGMVAHEAGWI